MIEVISVCPLQVTSLLWRPKPSSVVFTVICKATYTLTPGESSLSPEQETLNEHDNYWDDDPARSVIAPSDLAPIKRRPEVLLVGHAFAPGGKPARSLVARIVVGDLDKAIEVTCDRTVAADGTIQEGPAFMRMPLRYERAIGGPGTWNPVGVRGAVRDAFGRRILPNLTPAYRTNPDDPPEPVGFGPFPPSWPSRVQKLGGRAEGRLPDIDLDRPLPQGLDLAYFNQAPRDQWLSHLNDDQRIALENLHPAHPMLITALPGFRPAVFLDQNQGWVERIQMLADTLWIDTDRGIATVTWRGPILLEQEDAEGRLLVDLEPPNVQLKWADVEQRSGANPSFRSVAQAHRPSFDSVVVLDDEANAALQRPVLPFAPSAPRVDTPPSESRPDLQDGLPFQRAPLVSSPWPPVAAPSPPRSSPVASSTAAVPSSARAARSLPEFEPGFVPPSASSARPALQLVWFDPESATRICRAPLFRSLLDARKDRPLDRERDDPAVEREVFEILARGHVTDASGVEDALAGAVDEDGRFIPPVVLLSGEIELPFDELETLKAAVSTTASIAMPSDEALRAALLVAKELLGTPGLSASPPVSEALTMRILEAFAKEKSALPADFLETRMERILLAERHYQRRALLGEVHHRVLLRTSAVDRTMVGYLSAKAATRLPMFRRFRGRVLAEVHLAEEQFEASPSALRILALLRIAELPGRREGYLP